ncbi:MAG: methylenetetrahydrofolate reductase [Proteobacteria bacterium]|nr:methylenetetrahydrofolate reductase [Pseudomonadota bacterium]
MRIADLYGRGEPVISFEFFPPKTDKGFRALFRTIEELKRLAPGFVSVTMGAGGSTRRKTVELVTQIQKDIGITAMAHLPCVGFSRADLRQVLDRLDESGLQNVLALSGDAPPGAEDDLRNLVRKVEDGAEFLISQLFFDNEAYFSFEERARAAGIDVPIVPGIMPITSAANIQRITAMCGSRIPRELEAELEKVAEDDDATMALGVEWATLQCRELLARGAAGIHFYTLNKSPATQRIHESLFETG